MVSPAVPVPTKVGVLSLVRLSVLLTPVSLLAATSAVGAFGNEASMRNSLVVVSVDALPAKSVTVAVTG